MVKKKPEELCEREKRDEEVCWKRESGVRPVNGRSNNKKRKSISM